MFRRLAKSAKRSPFLLLPVLLLSSLPIFSTLIHTLPSLFLPISITSTSLKFCQLPGHCIFDLGHNNGQDTRFYLTDPTARVIAVDANPVLIDASSRKFRSHLNSGRLILLATGLNNQQVAENETITFYVNVRHKFSSFKESAGCRNLQGNVMPPGDHSFCTKVEQSVRSCASLIQEFGTPEYLKIDIEGLGTACAESLQRIPFHARPRYLSMEGVKEKKVHLLVGLGYDHFKAVDQKALQVGADKLRKGYSGPWGDDAVDDESGKRWMTTEEFLNRLPLEKADQGVWFDIHARKSDNAKGFGW